MQKKLKNQRGSVALFVLLSALFFLVVVTSVAVSYKNKEAQIDSQIEKIKQSYAKDAGQVYDEVTSNPELEVKKSTNIGKKVTFVSQYSNDLVWRLFYADDNYVYLISTKIGTDGSTEISPQRTAHTSLGYLGLIQDNIVIKGYSGSNAITDNYLRSLNSLWYQMLGNSESETESAKSVAWLMDQDVWEIWKDNDGMAEYVIGGPTAELFVKSYNATAEINNTSTLKCTINSDGYVVTKNNSSDPNPIFSDDVNYGIYTSNANEGDYNLFWIASPRGMPGDSTWEGKAILDINSLHFLYLGKDIRQ